MSQPSTDPRLVPAHWIALLSAIGASVPWSVLALTGAHPAPVLTAVLAGISILGAAFVLSWGVETAEMDVPPALAVTVLALVAVLPEYAVDATFAWKAASDPQQAHYAIANMTGGNRLLIGVGWSMMVFLAWSRFGKPGIQLPKSARVDIGILSVASLYALVPVWRGALTLFDTAVLVSLYAVYVVAAVRLDRANRAARGPDFEEEEEELIGPSALLGAYPTPIRRSLLAGLLVWCGVCIFLAAEPFAHALVTTGLEAGIDEFLLVQWLAPLASESPELAVAALLVLRGHGEKGMLTLVSSKVNQWTLLVGTLPVVTTIAAGKASSLAMDTRQQEEVLLTAAQSVFAVAVVADLFIARWQAVLLALLFGGQFLVPDAQGRHLFSIAYLVGAAAVMVLMRDARRGALSSFGGVLRALRGRTLE
jgi:cation:H+ antiporter